MDSECTLASFFYHLPSLAACYLRAAICFCFVVDIVKELHYYTLD
jgi:hypothetical protein